MGSGCQPWMNTVGGGGVGVWVLCVFVSLCACNFVHPTTNFPSILLPPCHDLACHFHALPPLPSTQPPFPSALSISMKNSDSDDYAALFFFFCLFATQQWCDGLSYMPHGCSLLIGGLSRHIHTRNSTRFCTHILSYTGDLGLGCVCLVSLPLPLPPLPYPAMAPLPIFMQGTQ